MQYFIDDTDLFFDITSLLKCLYYIVKTYMYLFL